MSDTAFRSDPALYREMSVPHESADTANAAVQAFAEDVAAARKKHRIRDVLVVAQLGVTCGETEKDAATSFSFGDQGRIVELAAYAYGAETEAQAEWLSGLANWARGAIKT